MSYKYGILLDSPILFYRSNDIYLDSSLSYQDILNTYSTYQLFESSFLNYESISGNFIKDASPCNNNAEYVGYLDQSSLPLIPEESHAIKIDLDNSIIISTIYDYNQSVSAGGLGTKTTSDNDFTLETWFYPSFTTSNKTPIMGDLTENVGLFYEKGNIIFAVDTEEISYTLPYLNKSYYIVATYNSNSISLYLDSELVASKEITKFTFSNINLSMKSGPTLNAGDYFLINGMAAYRYSLGSIQVATHYNLAKTLIPIQIANPEGGELFEFYDNSISTQYSYS